MSVCAKGNAWGAGLFLDIRVCMRAMQQLLTFANAMWCGKAVREASLEARTLNTRSSAGFGVNQSAPVLADMRASRDAFTRPKQAVCLSTKVQDTRAKKNGC